MKVVFFDLDDTLLKSKEINFNIFDKIKNLLGLNIDTKDFLRTFRTILRKNMLRYADYPINDLVGLDSIDLLMVNDDYKFADLISFKNSVVKDLKSVYKIVLDEYKFFDEILNMRNDYSLHIDGMRELIVYLKEQGYKIGIITNGASEVQHIKIDKANLRDIVDYIYVSGDFKMGKPDLKFYKMILDDVGVKPTNSIMIGDNLVNDYLGALAAGMNAIYFGQYKDNYKTLNATSSDELKKEINKIFSN